jgi:hypothetical protein
MKKFVAFALLCGFLATASIGCGDAAKDTGKKDAKPPETKAADAPKKAP